MLTNRGQESGGQQLAGNNPSGDKPITVAETMMAMIAIAAVAAFLILTAACIKRWGEGGFSVCLITAVALVVAMGVLDSARGRRSSRRHAGDSGS